MTEKEKDKVKYNGSRTRAHSSLYLVPGLNVTTLPMVQHLTQLPVNFDPNSPSPNHRGQGTKRDKEWDVRMRAEDGVSVLQPEVPSDEESDGRSLVRSMTGAGAPAEARHSKELESQELAETKAEKRLGEDQS